MLVEASGYAYQQFAQWSESGDSVLRFFFSYATVKIFLVLLLYNISEQQTTEIDNEIQRK